MCKVMDVLMIEVQTTSACLEGIIVFSLVFPYLYWCIDCSFRERHVHCLTRTLQSSFLAIFRVRSTAQRVVSLHLTSFEKDPSFLKFSRFFIRKLILYLRDGTVSSFCRIFSQLDQCQSYGTLSHRHVNLCFLWNGLISLLHRQDGTALRSIIMRFLRCQFASLSCSNF